MRDVLIIAFGVTIIGSTAYMTFIASNPILGMPWSALIATIAFMGALKIVSNSMVFLQLDQRFRGKAVQRERNEEEGRMRRALKKQGLPK